MLVGPEGMNLLQVMEVTAGRRNVIVLVEMVVLLRKAKLGPVVKPVQGFSKAQVVVEVVVSVVVEITEDAVVADVASSKRNQILVVLPACVVPSFGQGRAVVGRGVGLKPGTVSFGTNRVTYTSGTTVTV